MSHVQVELTPESEAVRVNVINDRSGRRRSRLFAKCGRMAPYSFTAENAAGDRQNLPPALKLYLQETGLKHKETPPQRDGLFENQYGNRSKQAQ